LDVIPWSKVPRSNVLECIDTTKCQFLNKSSKLAKVPIVRETRTKTQNSWFFNLPLKNVFVAITINPNPWRLIISPLHQMTVIFCGSWSGPTKQHSEEVLLNTIFYFNVQTRGLYKDRLVLFITKSTTKVYLIKIQLFPSRRSQLQMWNHVTKEAVLVYLFSHEKNDYLSEDLQIFNSSEQFYLLGQEGIFPI